MAALVGIATSKGLRFELGADNTLGRGDDVTIVLADVLVSQRHAEIRRIPAGGYQLADLGATHGTFLNGERVTVAPLSDGDEIIVGATRLRFEDRDPRAVTPSEVSVASAGHVIQHRVPVTRARFPDAAQLDLPAHARRDYERLRIAFEIGQALAVHRDLDDLLREILERSFELVPAERGAILLRDPQTGALAPRVAMRRGGGTEALVLPRSILDEVSTHRVGVLSIDASLDHRFGGRASVMAEGVRAALCAPLVHGDDLVGVIYLDAQIAGVFGERDLDVIATVAGQAALAVGTAQMRTTAETQERIALVSQVAAGLAHDFANVLMVVLSRADDIYQDPRVPSEHRENARGIETATKYAARLIRRFGGLARGPSTERRAVDLTRFLADARDLMQQALGDRITLVIESVGGPCPVMADPLELEQVLLNLVFNARDAMRGSGTFSIKVARSASEGRASATLLVADTGDGMPPEVVARAFDPFFTTKASGRGTGMGLAVVRRLITAAGGQISIDSRVGCGTTFRIDWPLTAAPTAAGDALEPIRASGESVLVIDDDDAVRAAMVSALETAGYVVIHAADGETGLAALADHPGVKLMIADVTLVGMTGRQVVERARSIHPDLAVVYVSSFTEPAEVEEITARGAGFLAKPFTARELVAKLQGTLRGDAHDPPNRRLELAASFADGAALLAGYDRGSNTLRIANALDPAAAERGVSVTVRLEDAAREFRLHGRIAQAGAAGAQIALDPDEIGAAALLLASASGESVPYFRRAEPRYPLRLEVRLRAESGLVIVSHSQDVSARGMMISTDHRIEVGTKIALRVLFPGREEPFTIAARVQSCIRSGPRRGIGVEYLFTSQEQRTEMSELVVSSVAR